MDGFLKLGEILWKLVYFGPFLLLIVLLNTADYFTTRKILKAGGIELNPVVKWIIAKKLFGVFKAVSTLFIVSIVWYYCARHATIMLIASIVICIIYIAVVINNVRQLCILKRNLK